MPRSILPRMHSWFRPGSDRTPVGRSFRSAVVLLAATLACACATLATNPPPLGAALAGQWGQDRAASDDFEAKLKSLGENQPHRRMPRHGAARAAGNPP